MACFSNKATTKPMRWPYMKILADAGYPELADILALDDLTQ